MKNDRNLTDNLRVNKSVITVLVVVLNKVEKLTS